MPARIFLTREFGKWASRSGIEDAALVAAVDEMERGLFDANLGGNVYKKRIARPGEGKSGGYRTILAFRVGDHVFFLKGFAKNERTNIAPGRTDLYQRDRKRRLQSAGQPD